MKHMGIETWIILGGSSAIARAYAQEAARHGCAVILAGRDIEDLQRTAADITIRTHVNCQVLHFDANKLESHTKFVKQCLNLAKGHINVLLAFAIMPSQSNIDKDAKLQQQIIHTNYVASVSILTHFAPIFEKQKSGHIAAIGSVAGDRGRLENYVYGSTKTGLHTFLQGFRARLYRQDVTVTTIKPGFIDTSMTYGKEGMFLVASPQACAEAIFKQSLKGKEVYYFPWFWRWIMLSVRLIPERYFKKTNI